MSTFGRRLTIASLICLTAGLTLALTGVSVPAGLALSYLGMGLALLRGPRRVA
jgi:hypothetical protein